MFLPNHLISVATQQFLDSKIYDFNTARLESPSYLMPRALDHSLPISFATYESSSTITPQSTKFTSRDLATVRVNSLVLLRSVVADFNICRLSLQNKKEKHATETLLKAYVSILLSLAKH